MSEVTRYTAAHAPLVRRSRRSKERPCPCGCGQAGLCDSHRERLAAIRADMVVGHGEYKQRWEKNRKRKPPSCCNPQCDSPRPRGTRYCADCVDQGWEEPE